MKDCVKSFRLVRSEVNAFSVQGYHSSQCTAVALHNCQACHIGHRSRSEVTHSEKQDLPGMYLAHHELESILAIGTNIPHVSTSGGHATSLDHDSFHFVTLQA